MRAVLDQLLADLRADEIHAQQLAPKGRPASQRRDHLLAQLRAGHVLTRGQPDQRGLSELPKLCTVASRQADLLQRRAHFVEVGGVPVGQFHHRTAGELHAQVQPAGDQEEHRQQEHDERDHVEYQRVAHEVDVFADAEEFHLLGLVLASELCLDRVEAA